MKKNFLFFVSILFFLISCKTNTIFVPGEKNVVIKNIYLEYYNLAEEYVKLENYTKAIGLYEFAMKDKSLHDACYYKIGQCYSYTKQYDEAIKVFKNILKKDEKNVSIKSSLAYLTAMKGDLQNASIQYASLVSDNPDNSDLLVNYISVLIALKDYETAKINLEYLENKFPLATQLKSLKENLQILEDSMNAEPNKNTISK